LLMALAPGFQRIDHGFETLADFGQTIFHARRHFGIDLSDDEPVLLQRTKLLGQHALGNPRHPPAQLAEALGTRLQMKQDHALPLAVDQVEGRLHRTARPTSEILALHQGFLEDSSISIQTGTISPNLQYLPSV